CFQGLSILPFPIAQSAGKCPRENRKPLLARATSSSRQVHDLFLQLDRVESPGSRTVAHSDCLLLGEPPRLRRTHHGEQTGARGNLGMPEDGRCPVFHGPFWASGFGRGSDLANRLRESDWNLRSG